MDLTSAIPPASIKSSASWRLMFLVLDGTPMVKIDEVFCGILLPTDSLYIYIYIVHMKKEDSRTRATSLQLKIDIESRTDVVFLTGVNITQTNPFILTVPALNKPLKHGSCPAHDFTWLNLWQGTNLRLRIGLGHHKQYLRCCQARWGTSYRESTKKNEDVVFSFPEWWGDHVPNAALGGFNPMTFTTIAWAGCLKKKKKNGSIFPKFRCKHDTNLWN